MTGHCKAYQITYQDMYYCASVSKLIDRNDFQGNPPKSVSSYKFFHRFVCLSTLQSCWRHKSPQEYIQAFKPSSSQNCRTNLRITMDFQKVILETEQSFHQSESSQVWFKRSVDVSPSISQPPRSRLLTTSSAHSARPSARTSLWFDSCQDPDRISK